MSGLKPCNALKVMHRILKLILYFATNRLNFSSAGVIWLYLFIPRLQWAAAFIDSCILRIVMLARNTSYYYSSPQGIWLGDLAMSLARPDVNGYEGSLMCVKVWVPGDHG